MVSSVGVAGELNGSIKADFVGAFEVDGDLSLMINTTNSSVSREFTLGGRIYARGGSGALLPL